MGRSGRVLGLLRPYRLLFGANIVATIVSSILDGATFVLVLPFLRALFKLQALPATGSSTVEKPVAGNACSLNKARRDRKSTRLNSSHLVISYAVFCLS